MEDRLCQCCLHTGAIVFWAGGPQGVAESSAPETRAPGAPLYRDPRHLALHAHVLKSMYRTYLRIQVNEKNRFVAMSDLTELTMKVI